MAQIKLAEYTFDNSVGDVTLTLTPNTITMTTEDSVRGTTTRRIVYIDNAIMPTQIMFSVREPLLTVDYLNIDSNITSMYKLFLSAQNLTYINVDNWDTSNVTDFYQCFGWTNALTQNIDFTKMNLSKVTNWHMAFAYSSFPRIDLSNSSPILADAGREFFAYCKAEYINISGWTFTRAMGQLFNNAEQLKTVVLNNVTTTGVTNMKEMFRNCYNLKTIDVSSFDTSSVTDASHMFTGCERVTEIKGIENFNVSSNQWFNNMFYKCSSLTKLDLRNWITSSGKDMGSMFNGCTNLEILRVDNFDTSKCYSTTMINMFNSCRSLKTLNLNSFNTSNITSLNAFFNGCENLECVSMQNFDTSNITSFQGMFNNCKKLKYLDLTTFVITESASFTYCFYGVDNLFPIYYNSNICTNTAITNRTDAVDVKGRLMAVYDFNNTITSTDVYPVLTGSIVTKTIDTQGSESHITHRVIGVDVMPTEIKFGDNVISGLLNVDYLAVTNTTTSLKNLFYNCNRLSSIMGTEMWDLKNITSMERTFQNCYSLTTPLNFYSNTGALTSIYGCFWDCSAPEINGIKDWNVSLATNFGDVFGYVKATSLDISGWDMSNGLKSPAMFSNCVNLTNLKIGVQDWSKIGQCNSMFSTCTSLMELDLTGVTFGQSVTNTSDMFSGWTSDQIVHIHDTNWTVNVSSYNATFVRRLSKLIARYTFNNTVSDCLPKFNNTILPSSPNYKISDMINGTVTTRLISVDDEALLPTRIHFSDDGYSAGRSIITCDYLNTSNCTSLYLLFYACDSYLTSVNMTGWDTSKVTNLHYAFYRNNQLTEIIGIEDIDTSSLVDARGIFNITPKLTTLDLSKWDVSKVQVLSRAFSGCGATTINISTWNTCSATTMESMFESCALTELDITHFDTSNVTILSDMFSNVKISSIDLSGWDVRKVQQTRLMFNSGSIKEIKLDGWNTESLTDMWAMFCGSGITTVDINHFNVSKVTNASQLFDQCQSLVSVDMSNLHFTSCQNISSMFSRCGKLTTVKMADFTGSPITAINAICYQSGALTEIDLTTVDVSRVTNMSNAFEWATSLKTLDLSTWDTRKATMTNAMFQGWDNTQTVYYEPPFWSIGTTTLNSNINWVVNITRNNGYWLDMTGITGDTTITMVNYNNLPTEDILTDWGDGTQNSELTHTYSTAGEYIIATNLQHNESLRPYTIKVNLYYNASLIGLFMGFAKLTEIILADNFITECNSRTQTSFERMFNGCWALSYLPSNFTKLNFSNVANVASMLNYSGLKEVDLTGWTTNNVKSWGNLFNSCKNLEKVNFGNVDFSENTSTNSMFIYCSKLTSENINFGTGWTTSNVTDMASMFNGCSSLTSLDLSSWDTSKVTTISKMFWKCTSLTDCSFIESWDFSSMDNMLDAFAYSSIKSFNFRNKTLNKLQYCATMLAYNTSLESVDFSGTTMTYNGGGIGNPAGIFDGCTNLKTAKFDNMTFIPKNCSNMFRNCSSLTSLDLSSWDVSQCTTLQDMFLGCTSLITLNLANWNTSKVRMMSSVFYNCPKLKNLDITGWDTSSVGNMESMFFNNQAGMSLDLSSFNTQKVTTMNTIFQSCIFSSLDISNWTINDTTGVNNMFNNCKVSTIGLLYTSDATINKITSLLPTATKPLTIYYHDADASQLTPVEGVTFKKYQNPTTIQLPPHIQLHSLPDGTRDEVDIKTGILTRNVGYTENAPKDLFGMTTGFGRGTFYNGEIDRWIGSHNGVSHSLFRSIVHSNFSTKSSDTESNIVIYTSGSDWINISIKTSELISKGYEATSDGLVQYVLNEKIMAMYPTSTPTTEQLILNYNNSCDYGRILPTGMCDKYSVVDSMYTQTMTSILLDGENTWDAMEEFENTVKFTATGTTVGVENLNMLGAGGLYCDNDLFPNINDDSDVPHCRVDEAGNKFYIYVDKEMLMSPDLIGWQIWLQANPFNLIYELAEHLTYVKPYEELDATQARWEGMDCMRDGAIKYHTNSSDNITMYPTLEYVAPSINNFEVTMLEPNTDYTIYAEGINDNDTINLGGTDINFNNGTVYTSGDNQWLRIDNNDSFYNMVITKGDTTGEVVPYFEGMTSVENPKVQCGESTVSYTDLKLRSLPNGVKDTINVVTGEYIQRVGEITFDGSEDWVLSAHENSTLFYTPFNNLVRKVDYLNGMNCDKLVVHIDGEDLYASALPNGISGYSDWREQYPNENWLYIKYTDSEGSVEKLKQWLSQNPITVQYELAEPITTKLDPQTLLAYTDGTINLSSDTGLLPTTHYTVPSTNTFHLPSMKTGTRYTLKYPSASGSITIGDINYSISSDSMLFTTPLKINGDTSAIIFSDANPENVVLLEGAYNKREVPFFTGVKSVKNPNITIIDQLSTESTTYNCETEIELRGLPNGVADKLDIVKGKLTTNVGIRPYQEGDENLPNIWTDGYETVYALSSPVVTNVTIDHPTVTTNSLIELSSDYLIPQLNYRAPSSNNFPLDLLQPNTTYTLYADTLVSGSYTLGGTKTEIYSQPHTITLGDITDNLLTFNGDLGLSNVMLVKGNSLKTTLPPYFLGIRSVTDGHLLVEGMAGEINELTFDEGIVLRDCNGVKDTIDLITCTLTKRTGEITLTGSEGWFTIPNESVNAPDDYVVFALTLQGVDSSNKYDLICDTITSKYLYNKPHDTESIYGLNNSIRMCVKKSRIGGDTVNALKSWLNQNPTTVVYSLKTPIEVPLENVWTTTPPTSYNNQTEISSTVSTNSLKPMISVTIATTTLEEIVSNLEAQNAQLEEENMATMLALTSVYETMVAPMAASTMSLDNEPSTVNLSDGKDGNNINGMSVSPIGMVYVNLIRKGLKTIEQVPYNLQPEVMYALRGME